MGAISHSMIKLRCAPPKEIHALYCKPIKKHMAMEVIGPMEYLLLLFSKIGIVSNCLLNIYIYSHKQMLLSDLLRETSLFL